MSLFLNLDCNIGMAEMPDKCIDVAIVDPPYGINIGKKVGGDKPFGTVTHGSGGSNKIIESKEYRAFDDSKIPDSKYFSELFRVSKNQIIWGGNYFIEHLKNTSCMIVWDKVKSGYFADAELAWTSFKTATRIFKYQWNGLLQEDMKNKEKRIHPTQKPVALYKWLIKNYCEKGMKILDTHVGSGSSLIACEEFGLEYIAYEDDEETYKQAKERLEIHRSQLQLFKPDEIW